MQNIMIEYEKFSYSQIEQVQGWFDVNSDIRWFSNAVGEFGDELITEYYEKDDINKIKFSESFTENQMTRKSFVQKFLQSVKSKMYRNR